LDNIQRIKEENEEEAQETQEMTMNVSHEEQKMILKGKMINLPNK
jgi:hypothetical protein